MSKELQSAIVSITSSEPDNYSFGTGFIVHFEDGLAYVVTCAHVITDVGGADCALVMNKAAVLVAAGSADDLTDIAVLKVSVDEEAHSRLLLNTSARTDNLVSTIGFQTIGRGRLLLRELSGKLGKQIGLEARGKSGRVKAWDLIITDSYELQPGYSGSPVIHETLEFVVGIVSHRQGAERGIAIAIETLKAVWADLPLELLQTAKTATVTGPSISTSNKSNKLASGDYETLPSQNFTMLYGDKRHIGLLELERLVQMSVLMADTVYVGAHCAPHPQLDHDSRKLILRKLLELHEIGAIRVWEFENFKLDQLLQESLGLHVDNKKRTIVDRESYNSMYNAMTRKALTDVSLFYKLAPREKSERVQGVTEIVEGRTNLWNIALASHLGAERILVDDKKRVNVQHQMSKFYRHSSIEGPALEKFLDVMNVGPLSPLEQKAIADCRLYTQQFRQEFLRRSGKMNLELGDEEQMTSELVKQLVQEYADELERLSARGGSWGFLREAGQKMLFDLVGYFSPQAMLGGVAAFLQEWGITRSSKFPLFLLVKLRGATRDGGPIPPAIEY